MARFKVQYTCAVTYEAVVDLPTDDEDEAECALEELWRNGDLDGKPLAADDFEPIYAARLKERGNR